MYANIADLKLRCFLILNQNNFLFLSMTSFLINIDTKKEAELKLLAKQLQIPLIKLSSVQKEDIGLNYLMEKADRTKTVTKEKVLKKLKAKCS